MNETDLYRPVTDYLRERNYTIRGEVGGCDITAVKEDELIIVELKLGFNLTLLLQAVQRQRITDSVYLAVPKPRGGMRTKKWRNICHLLRRLEIGLMVVSLSEVSRPVEILFDPAPFVRRKSKRKRAWIMREINGRSMEYNIGGSVRKKLITAYRENCLFIAGCLIEYGPLSPAALRKIGTGTKTQSILSKNFYGWFRKTERGVYDICPDAKADLEKYSDLLKFYEKRIQRTLPAPLSRSRS